MVKFGQIFDGVATSGDIRQIQGAGGVGGLLAASVIKTSDSTSLGNLYASYDGNGNILAWSAPDGSVKQSQDYDAFGNVILRRTPTGSPLAPSQGELTYGFSTKPQDPETKLLYYGYRYYDPATGRWPSRDPIEENGGDNLYSFIVNNAQLYIDYLGKQAIYGPGNLPLNPSQVPDMTGPLPEPKPESEPGTSISLADIMDEVIKALPTNPQSGVDIGQSVVLGNVSGVTISGVWSFTGRIICCISKDGTPGIVADGTFSFGIGAGVGASASQKGKFSKPKLEPASFGISELPECNNSFGDVKFSLTLSAQAVFLSCITQGEKFHIRLVSIVWKTGLNLL